MDTFEWFYRWDYIAGKADNSERVDKWIEWISQKNKQVARYSAAETADYLLKILIEANTEKVQSAIQEAATASDDTEEKMSEGHSA